MAIRHAMVSIETLLILRHTPPPHAIRLSATPLRAAATLLYATCCATLTPEAIQPLRCYALLLQAGQATPHDTEDTLRYIESRLTLKYTLFSHYAVRYARRHQLSFSPRPETLVALLHCRRFTIRPLYLYLRDANTPRPSARQVRPISRRRRRPRHGQYAAATDTFNGLIMRSFIATSWPRHIALSLIIIVIAYAERYATIRHLPYARPRPFSVYAGIRSRRRAATLIAATRLRHAIAATLITPLPRAAIFAG